MSGTWYVHCGCAHGDHLACEAGCAEHRCRHPLGVVISVDDGNRANELSGQEPPPELVVEAVRDRIREIRRETNREVDRLIAIVEDLTRVRT